MSEPAPSLAGKTMIDLIRDVRAGKLKPLDVPSGVRKHVVYFAKALPAASIDAPKAPPVDYHHAQRLGPIRRTRSA